jgi:hypothetical protein
LDFSRRTPAVATATRTQARESSTALGEALVDAVAAESTDAAEALVSDMAGRAAVAIEGRDRRAMTKLRGQVTRLEPRLPRAGDASLARNLSGQVALLTTMLDAAWTATALREGSALSRRACATRF